MSKDQPATQPIRKQAIQWLIAKNSGTWSTVDQQALESWLAEDNQHMEQYRQMQLLWGSMDAFKEKDFPQRQAAMQYQPPTDLDNVVNFPGLNPSEIKVGHQVNESRPILDAPRSSTHWLKTGFAVAASILIALSIQTYRQTGIEHYQTAKGEQKTIFLADGSQIMLNTDSEITVNLALFERKVQLARGEVLLNVSHNPLRPFAVTAGNGRIRDIGTRFDVYAQNNRVDIAVLEGEVAIATHADKKGVSLTAGQAATYDADGKLNATAMPDPLMLTAWERGKLIFADQPLAEVLSQIARYHTVEFQIADPKLRDLKISGTFKTANLQLLLETLEAGFPIKAQIIDSQHVRLQRSSHS
ncbi:FecR family protein [Methylomonas sp. AM2-LC]|uniref:FecR family protein n=1 Tax=Methylomonas sp. AM2-LC TaxID=3153301 RepID=UPI0032658866